MSKKYVFTAMVFFLLIIIFMLPFFSTMHSEKSTSYYSIEQFSSLVLKESTVSDVEKIANIDRLYCTSFGAVAEFPTEDNRWIQIRLTGADLIVDSIQVAKTPWNTTG